MTPEPKSATRKAIEREVGELERRLTPAQRRAYTRHLMACQLQNVVVTAETRLEWLKEIEVR